MLAAAISPFDNGFPVWIPQAVRRYLIHTEEGLSFRHLARSEGCHASTVLRQVRRFENRRDDPLVDEALRLLSEQFSPRLKPVSQEGLPNMTAHARNHSETYSKSSNMAAIAGPAILADADELAREARRILRRLCETGAVLALAPDMDKAVVLRTLKDGPPTRTAVVSRDVAQAFALKDWIRCARSGRVASYTITAGGRAALKTYLAEDMERKRRARSGRDGSSPFSQQAGQSERDVMRGDGEMRPMRSSMAESPLAMLARRRDKAGRPFLDADLVQAGERFREDFELAQMGTRVAQNWDSYMSSGDRNGFIGSDDVAEGAKTARGRMLCAMDDLGPGLGDIIMRCCCFLEGLETAEKRMGWSARSGKVVLRIALQRLRCHYMQKHGHVSAMIG